MTDEVVKGYGVGFQGLSPRGFSAGFLHPPEGASVFYDMRLTLRKLVFTTLGSEAKA